MEINKAIEILKDFDKQATAKEDGAYQTGDGKTACDMGIYALKKQYPQKIILNSEDDREYEDYICPNCKTILQQRRKGAMAVTIYHFAYCHSCGQALDWRDIHG